MAKGRGDFTDGLVKKKIISVEQAHEAAAMATSTGLKLQDALQKLNYVTLNESAEAMAEHGGFQFVGGAGF